MALFGRKQLPARSTLSPEPVEALRTLFLSWADRPPTLARSAHTAPGLLPFWESFPCSGADTLGTTPPPPDVPAPPRARLVGHALDDVPSPAL